MTFHDELIAALTRHSTPGAGEHHSPYVSDDETADPDRVTLARLELEALAACCYAADLLKANATFTVSVHGWHEDIFDLAEGHQVLIEQRGYHPADVHGWLYFFGSFNPYGFILTIDGRLLGTHPLSAMPDLCTCNNESPGFLAIYDKRISRSGRLVVMVDDAGDEDLWIDLLAHLAEITAEMLAVTP